MYIVQVYVNTNLWTQSTANDKRASKRHFHKTTRKWGCSERAKHWRQDALSNVTKTREKEHVHSATKTEWSR